MIEIVPVENKKQLATFIDLPHTFYAKDPNYVPELFLGQQDLLSPKKHPFYQHSSAQPFFWRIKMVKLWGVFLPYGTIIIMILIRFKKANSAFFESINNQEVADALLQTATAWVKEKGGTKIVGPINLTTNDVCGLLIDGFDKPPMAMMPYNPPYYSALINGANFTTKTDLRAYWVATNTASQRSVLLLEKLEARLKRSGIVLREINLKDFANEAKKIKEVYNKAWDENLGFVPMTDAEFDFTAKELKMIVNPKFCIVAEKDNQIVGFALGIPNINEVLINVKRGRLLPFGIFKLLFGLKKLNPFVY